MASIPDAVLLSEVGRRNNARRSTKGAGTGRPKSGRRCPCGKFTKRTAKTRGHKCTTTPTTEAEISSRSEEIRKAVGAKFPITMSFRK